MSIGLKLYMKLPYQFQNMILNIKAFQLNLRRYGPGFNRLLVKVNNNDHTKVNFNQLKLFLEEANKLPYWNQQFKKYNVNYSSTNLEKELLKLPVINKNIVKTHFNSIMNNAINLNTKMTATSGTTGSGLKFPETKQMEINQWAVWWRFRKRHGIEYGTWCGWFGGRIIMSKQRESPPYWLINFPMKQIMFSSYHLNDNTVHSYYKKINRSKLSWLHGYPSQLAHFAHLCKKYNFRSFPFLKIISIGAENLLVHQKLIIEDVFKVRVIQHYGLAEGVSNISENIYGKLEPDQDFAYTELIPIDSSKPSLCRIVGTNYNNLAFPLIRYDTGDIATVSWKNKKPKILSIDGRNEDYITLKSGVKLGRLDHIFKTLIHIQKAQIYQGRDKKIIIYIVKDEMYDSAAEESNLINQLELYIGKEESIKIEYVKHIKDSNSSKFRLVISETI